MIGKKIQLLEDNTREYVYDIGIGKEVLNRT